MTWRWLISFSLAAAPLWSADVAGRVELVNSQDAAVARKKDFSGVVVSLHGAPTPPTAQATMLQKDKTFTPHVLAITKNSTVSFPNLDPIFHSAFSNYNGQIFDVGLYPPKTTRIVKFAREGVVRVFCNIHSAMSAVIVVLDTPYFAVTQADGSFRIAGVAPGEYQLRFFHERATETELEGLSKTVRVAAEALTLPPTRISESGFINTPHTNKFGGEYRPEPRNPIAYPTRRH